MSNRRMFTRNRLRSTPRRRRWSWLRQCSSSDSITGLITGRIGITAIMIMTVIIIMTGMITAITAATIGIIIGGKTHVMVCKARQWGTAALFFFCWLQR